MKPFLLVICFLVVFGCAKDADLSGVNEITKTQFVGELDWVKTYGGSGEETAQAIIATADGGYAVLGFSNSTDGDLEGKSIPVNDYWLLKLDGSGALEWSKTYGGSKDDRGQSLVQTKDGGYALTGYAMSDDGDGSVNKGFHDNWVLKLDALGAIEWEKSFGFSGHDHSYDILQTEDEGLFFVGFLDITSARADGNTEKLNSVTSHGVGEFWASKVDAHGALQWRGYYGGSNNDRAHAVVQADDGGFVLAGFTESDDFDVNNSRGSYDFWVVKINNSGTTVWKKSYGGTGIERAQDIAKTNDGGFVITGSTFSNDVDVSKNNGESDIWLIKIDAAGELVWEQTFGGSQFDAAHSVIASKDGGFIITGNAKSTNKDLSDNAGENDIWLIKTDANGSMVWQKTFGGSGLDYGFDAVETVDGSIVVVGETASADFQNIQNKGRADVVVLKVK